MKKLHIILCISIISLMFLFVGCGTTPNLTTYEGRFFKSDTGDIFILRSEDLQPLMMVDLSENENLFDNVQTGDLISIQANETIEMAYPSSTGCYSCELIQDGSINDINQDTLEYLTKLGYTYNNTNTVNGLVMYDNRGNLFISVNDETPYIIYDNTNDNIFENVKSYDYVTVQIDSQIQEIFPSRVGCYSCEIVEHKSSADLDEGKFTQLIDMGYQFQFEN